MAEMEKNSCEEVTRDSGTSEKTSKQNTQKQELLLFVLKLFVKYLNLVTSSQLFSKYKHHVTMKRLVGITW